MFNQYASRAGVHVQFRASRACSGGDGLADCAHAADRMAPRTFHAIALAEHMVQQYVGAARCIRACIVADNAIKTEQGLDRLALEPAVQVLGGRQREKVQQFLA